MLGTSVSLFLLLTLSCHTLTDMHTAQKMRDGWMRPFHEYKCVINNCQNVGLGLGQNPALRLFLTKGAFHLSPTTRKHILPSIRGVSKRKPQRNHQFAFFALRLACLRFPLLLFFWGEWEQACFLALFDRFSFMKLESVDGPGW